LIQLKEAVRSINW